MAAGRAALGCGRGASAVRARCERGASARARRAAGGCGLRCGRSRAGYSILGPRTNQSSSAPEAARPGAPSRRSAAADPGANERSTPVRSTSSSSMKGMCPTATMQVSSADCSISLWKASASCSSRQGSSRLAPILDAVAHEGAGHLCRRLTGAQRRAHPQLCGFHAPEQGECCSIGCCERLGCPGYERAVRICEPELGLLGLAVPHEDERSCHVGLPFGRWSYVFPFLARKSHEGRTNGDRFCVSARTRVSLCGDEKRQVAYLRLMDCYGSAAIAVPERFNETVRELSLWATRGTCQSHKARVIFATACSRGARASALLGLPCTCVS